MLKAQFELIIHILTHILSYYYYFVNIIYLQFTAFFSSVIIYSVYLIL